MRVRWIVPLAAIASVLMIAVGWTALAGADALLRVAIASVAPPYEDEDFGPSAVYSVDYSGELSPAPSPEAAEVWDMFERVAGAPFVAKSMALYIAGDNPRSDTMAYVHRSENPRFWTLGANLAYAEDRDILLATLVHEYGHIRSLGMTDVVPTTAACDTWELSEGCVLPDSELNAFFVEFWEPYGDAAPPPDATDEPGTFYDEHEADFVSDYAATNVVEDFAESFMTFVLEPRPDAADSPVARKLDFFWQLPDYVAARERIRTEFALD